MNLKLEIITRLRLISLGNLIAQIKNYNNIK
jgi:hypothetical protein